MKNNLCIVKYAIVVAIIPLTTLRIHAQEDLSPEQREHQHLTQIINDFVQYGAALESFTKVFFGVIPHSFNHNQLKELTQQLLITINNIKTKSTTYLKANPSKETHALLQHFKSLATLLISSQEKLNALLQQNLGTKKLIPELKKLGAREKNLLPKINTLRGKINAILVVHQDPELKKKFDTFIQNIEYSFMYPQKNQSQALAAALRHSSPR